ncbi:DUF4238 domain-containing protein [Rhizobium sp. Leaf341]|uniref:DUF4238 domain-containing protein n=1 Tax=Rhizobium sp. Leaf341 TaxID=1736344 RepID=UPI00071623AA|nr:DUF4238 domain-containing protein [Rhizobium sp. Leaf341]KQR77793.1 hypothetical protein ASG03_15585 [Rhizobium sp. Leaf341]
MTKHHYIPQFYLLPWLGSDNKLTEFRKLKFSHEALPRLEVKRRGTMETGWEENLYILRGATKETRDNVERIFMGAVDGKAALARDRLLKGDIPQDNETRHAWARFLLSLMIRTPETIRGYKAHMRHTFENPDAEFQARYMAARDPHHPESLRDYFIGEGADFQDRSTIIIATRLIQNQKVLQTLMRAMWWVVNTDKAKPFMTSDHPLVMTNGLGMRGGHFALTISPTCMFVGFNDLAGREAVTRIHPRKLVREANEAVIGQGRKSVYAVNDANIRDVKRHMGRRQYFNPVKPFT